MCGQIDGFVNFVVRFYVEMMFYVLKKADSNIQFDFCILSDQNYSQLFKKMPGQDEHILEQVLQVFSMISYLIFIKKELQIYYTQAFMNANAYLVKINNQYLKCKL